MPRKKVTKKKKVAKKKAPKKPPKSNPPIPGPPPPPDPGPGKEDLPEPGSIPRGDKPLPDDDAPYGRRKDGTPKKPPGRKAGSKARKSPAPVPPLRPRKEPAELVDLDQAVVAEHARLNKIYEEFNRRHGTKIRPLPEKVGDIEKNQVTIPEGALAGAFFVLFEVLGEIWDVEARPSEKQLAKLEKAWEPVIFMLGVNPMWIAVGGAVGATVGCTIPMWMEKRAIKAGELQPASIRKKERDDGKA